MPPAKRKVKSKLGRPPLPPEIRQSRQKRSIGIVEQADWERWQMAAQVAGIPTSEFITIYVNRAAQEVLASLSPQQLSAQKRKLTKAAKKHAKANLSKAKN